MIFSRFILVLISWPRLVKKTIVLILDLILCFLATWAAFCIRFDGFVPLNQILVTPTILSMGVATPIFIAFGLYKSIFRYAGSAAFLALGRAIMIYGGIYVTFMIVFGLAGVPRSIGLIQPILLFLGMGSLRLLIKGLLNRRNNLLISAKDNRSHVLIYGAGSIGRQLASGLLQSKEMKPIGFVDDDSRLWGSLINGLQIYQPNDIPQLVTSGLRVTHILLALPGAAFSRRKEIYTFLSELPVHVHTLPSMSELASGALKLEDISEVQIEDVLGREPVPAKIELLRQSLVNKVVMVTGAGGSIGSEICRQILVQNPKELVLFDQCEFALFEIDRELRRLDKKVKIMTILGSVLDANKISRVIREFGVQTIYHAAAYKHVPIVEENSAEGVWNNVFGTLRIVESACKYGVETFVLISTDKAVRPTNIMGCSKRIAELVVQAKALELTRLGNTITKLSIVRFGNVLGSSGSVVPLFREQIKYRCPITVTHPNITRYFMTIPEAAQLVIQAGSMRMAGGVMVLDMGEPVKILDLANRMINLSGLSRKDEFNPNGDIEIQFTGLRPGEKLYEELHIGENVLPTAHPRIMCALEYALEWDKLEPVLFELESAIKAENDHTIRLLLRQLVPEFDNPSEIKTI